jgi:hypothetical protein
MTPAPTAALRRAIYRRAEARVGAPEFMMNLKAG